MLEVIRLDLVGLASATSLQGKKRSGGPARNAGLLALPDFGLGCPFFGSCWAF